MMKQGFGYLLVAVQFICLLYFALTGPWIASGWLLWLEVLGILLGVWALLSMRVTRVSVLPLPRAGAQLVTRGPYRWIRHPMYAALLLTTLALVMDAPLPGRWGAWIVLGVDLVVKLNFEEQLLDKALAGYQTYKATSWRLVPWVY
jgi:protein-S-isoprenylcysteine O-methyltransferase Ste14